MKLNISKMERERKALGLSKSELSREAGIFPANYSYILKKESTRLETITNLAKALSIDPKDLLI